MIISFCEWVFAGADLPQVATMLAGHGYNGIEIAGEPNRPDRKAIAQIVADTGLTVTGITPQSVWPTDARDLSHPDPAARRRAVDYFCQCVDLATELGTTMIGVVPSSVGRLRPLTNAAEEWRLAVEGLREIGEHALDHGVRLGIEPLNRYESCMVNRIEQATRLIDDVALPSCLGIVADSFHLNIEETDPSDALLVAGDLLLCIQLADTNRLGLGMGHGDLGRFVAAARAAGFEGPYTMEFTAEGADPFNPNKGSKTFDDLDRAAALSIELLRQLIV